jgi:hypothetical protein
VYTRGVLDLDSPGGAQLSALNRELAEAYREWLAPVVERGQVRPMSMLVLSATVTGPTHAIARRWLVSQLGCPLHDYLADAACSALSGAVTKRRQATKGRVRLEMVSDAGEVIGRGEAIAEIVVPDTVRSVA